MVKVQSFSAVTLEQLTTAIAQFLGNNKKVEGFSHSYYLGDKDNVEYYTAILIYKEY